jgi:RimJ/RimL family protein N-acetyltransferase
LFESTAITVIHAYVKTGNDASERAFLKAGFVRLADEPLEGQSAAHLVLRRSPQKC